MWLEKSKQREGCEIRPVTLIELDLEAVLMNVDGLPR